MEGRQTLGTRLIWPDIRPKCACATFGFHVHYFDASTGAGIRRKKQKIALDLVVFTTCAVLLALMLTFVPVLLVKTRLLFLVPMLGLHFLRLVLFVALTFLLAWLVKLGFYASLRLMLAPFT